MFRAPMRAWGASPKKGAPFGAPGKLRPCPEDEPTSYRWVLAVRCLAFVPTGTNPHYTRNVELPRKMHRSIAKCGNQERSKWKYREGVLQRKVLTYKYVTDGPLSFGNRIIDL